MNPASGTLTARRSLLRGASLSVLGLTAGAAAEAVTPASAEAVTPASAEAVSSFARTACGAWSAVVTIPGRPPEYSLYALHGDGIVTHVSNNGFIGIGAWRPTGANTLSMSFREWKLSDAGQVEGSIQIHLDWTLQNSNSFTAVGRVKGFDLQGVQNFSGTSTATGSRYGLE